MSEKGPRIPQRVKSALSKASTGERSIHPAMVPGISVDDTAQKFPTTKAVFAIALAVSLAVFGWALLSPVGLNNAGTGMQSWVVAHFGWFFGALVVLIMTFMFVIGFGPTGRIRLGTDDSEPDYSTTSWISMLFAAGPGSGLIFYGPLEPLTHFLTPPRPARNRPKASTSCWTRSRRPSSIRGSWLGVSTPSWVVPSRMPPTAAADYR